MNRVNLLIWIGGANPPEGTPFAEAKDLDGHIYYVTANPDGALWNEFVERLKEEDEKDSLPPASRAEIAQQIGNDMGRNLSELRKEYRESISPIVGKEND